MPLKKLAETDFRRLVVLRSQVDALSAPGGAKAPAPLIAELSRRLEAMCLELGITVDDTLRWRCQREHDRRMALRRTDLVAILQDFRGSRAVPRPKLAVGA